MTLLLGCIADDLTGAADLALMLSRGGMRTVQVIDVPRAEQNLPDAEAVVVALKSRTVSPDRAVADTLASAEALLNAGARQIFFKYCSTFDSTPRGNIGPVAAALVERIGAPIAIACPAFPENGRTVYQGHLFVNGEPLHESPMKDHPLTPMRDSNLVRVLQRQTSLPVGLVDATIVDRGPDAIAAAIDARRVDGCRLVVVDALSERHLRDIGAAARDQPLVTGGSGVALGLPDNFCDAGLIASNPRPPRMTAPPGAAAILAGSCSAATRGQIAAAEAAGYPSFRLNPLAAGAAGFDLDAILAWARPRVGARPVLIYSSAAPDDVARAQSSLGRDAAGEMIEQAFAEIARRLVGAGVARLIVAGGETSGAVVNGLGVSALEIGPEIDPGVPWTCSEPRSTPEPRLALALKSGNFGAPDFFIKAWSLLT